MRSLSFHLDQKQKQLTVETDYCVAAFGIVLVISTFQWFVDGRKNYTGPRMNSDVDVLAGVVVASDDHKPEEGEHREK